MRNISRRGALRTLGTLPAGLLTAQAASSGSTVAPGTPSEDAAGWTYRPILPDDAAGRAYAAYPGNGCMFAVFSGVVGRLAEDHGAPFASFPLAMMKYGHGGAGGYGCLCGALNGAAALIGLFQAQQRTRDLLITELFKWYEETELPVFAPAGAKAGGVKSKSGSVLCHASIVNWCRRSGGNPYDKARGERCRRLSADVTFRTVELLNRTLASGRREITVSDGSASCMQCHANSETPQVTVRSLMDCGSCHHFEAPHPAPKLMP